MAIKLESIFIMAEVQHLPVNFSSASNSLNLGLRECPSFVGFSLIVVGFILILSFNLVRKVLT